MSYRFRLDDSVARNVRRIARKEVESAADLLRTARPNERDHAIHEARKSVKKVRALLRLVARPLGKTYRAENQHFRDIGRQLSHLRDAAALLEMFDDHFAQRNGDRPANSPQTAAIRSVRRTLALDKRAIASSPDTQTLIEQVASALSASVARVSDWPLPGEGFEALTPGLRKTYLRGRRAFAEALKNPSVLTYHNFRKRVKDHWYHVRLLADLSPETMQARAGQLKKLENDLGDDHNFAVLRARIEDQPQHYGGRKSVAHFLSLMDIQQQRLQSEAVTLAPQIYGHKPKLLVAEMARFWEASQPAHA